MCDCEPTRRELLASAAIATAGVLFAAGTSTAPALAAEAVPAAEVMPGLSIYPRDAWGADLPPKGAIEPESPQFLLVHHTASSNSYASARTVIRNTYAWQTSPSKGWPDVCYQFFVGRAGDVWEGRKGALVGPVRADATGGSQGFAQLVCLLGDFTTSLPTAAAQDSLVKVLAWLADRYVIDTADNAVTTFVSRGSQRYPRGQSVTTPTIGAHRDMSYTACPGDAFFPHMAEIRSRVIAQREQWSTVLKPARRLGIVIP